MRSNHKRNRAYNISKRSIKDDYIDKQVLVIHAAIVEKLILQPELLSQVQQTLNERKETGKIGYGEYITWLSIIETFADHSLFRKSVLENSNKMKRYRRKTPFTNILTEQEREQALTEGAIAEISDISVLY